MRFLPNANNERSLVDGSASDRSYVWRGIAWVVISIAALFAYGWPDSPWWLRALIGPLIGFRLGMASNMAYRRAAAFRRGWIDGRLAMLESLAESQRRDMPPHAWLLGELERNAAVLGPMGYETHVEIDDDDDGDFRARITRDDDE